MKPLLSVALLCVLSVGCGKKEPSPIVATKPCEVSECLTNLGGKPICGPCAISTGDNSPNIIDNSGTITSNGPLSLDNGGWGTTLGPWECTLEYKHQDKPPVCKKKGKDQ